MPIVCFSTAARGQKHLTRCIKSEGDYFEGDTNNNKKCERIFISYQISPGNLDTL
jgi:hypothetical protein